ncbi:MAG: DUF3786 domain-containing protein, partial [Deltaproteobacteria bacterium]|nr:DUF3786 domain-containing protein [Deltaproteobacteria bacterium]
MSPAYLQIRNDYLAQAWGRSRAELAAGLPAASDHDGLHFRAFGEDCTLTPADILLAGNSATGPEGLLIAMYAAGVPDSPVQLQPLQAFKEMPDSMPYQAAFAANAEQILVPHVAKIHARRDRLASVFSGQLNPDALSGDFSFTLWPLPRIPLYYIFNLSDEEFPASVTCLFAANAGLFMPLAGLADV